MANQSDNPRKVVSLPNREDVPSFADLEREIEAEQAADDARAAGNLDLESVKGRAHAINGALSTIELTPITGKEFWSVFNREPARTVYLEWVRTCHAKLSDILSEAER